MSITDSGTWHKQTTITDHTDTPAAVIYAVAAAVDNFKNSATSCRLSPDWTRANLTIHPEVDGMSVTVGAWCHPTGQTVEYAIPTHDDDADLNAAGRDEITPISEDDASDPEIRAWRRTVTRWEPIR